jgi:hypothetical protein
MTATYPMRLSKVKAVPELAFSFSLPAAWNLAAGDGLGFGVG